MRVGTAAALSLLVAATAGSAHDLIVRSAGDYVEAARKVVPGDRIIFGNGIWRDMAIVLQAKGTAALPIRLTAQHPGRAVFTGSSYLAISGSYIVVSNLVFREGHAPKDAVLSFRTDSRHWADHSRMTGMVIDGYNQPDRAAQDHWVALYGADNRFDHAYIEGKTNDGATLVVVRDKPYPLDNHARIDHNYFGPRPPLGKNGGETIRIGTSTQSQSASHTIVEDNYFDRCDGEVETISVKSGGNVIRGNVFVDNQGTITLRHGNGNLVERNVFLGHGVAKTGGIRVINRDQIVRDNYLEGLAGTDFRSAITVMNGVPDSPINRYLPVDHALIAHNSVITPSQITLGGGADAELSVPPRDVRFVADLIVGRGADEPIRALASTAGISFDHVVQAPAGKPFAPGIERRDFQMARAANGLLYPTEPALAAIGAPRDLRPISREAVGVPWYPKGRHAAANETKQED